MQLNVTTKELPEWLDRLIYVESGAWYDPYKRGFSAREFDEQETLRYLGTYFPRSYAESYCVFSDYFQRAQSLSERRLLRVFDFACGCGGEILGLLDAVQDVLPNVVEVQICGCDPNIFAIRHLNNILQVAISSGCYRFACHPNVIQVAAFDSLLSFKNLWSQFQYNYDLIMTFKSVIEILGTGKWGAVNPYEEFCLAAAPHLTEDGYLAIGEVALPVSMPDCPVATRSGAQCLRSINGGCSIETICQQIQKMARNGVVSGVCSQVSQGGCCASAYNHQSGSRCCAVDGVGVWLRDLLGMAANKRNVITDNLRAYQQGFLSERDFMINHSRKTGDVEQFYWAIMKDYPTFDFT